MKYIFRGHTIFEYQPAAPYEKVIQHKIHGAIPAFDYCSMFNEDYRLLAQFFDTVYRHAQGEEIVLRDIIVD